MDNRPVVVRAGPYGPPHGHPAASREQTWSWSAGPGFEPIPDVMLVPPTDDDVRFTGRPALVVEVLSKDPAYDLVIKAGRYAAAGLTHFWVVDVAAATVTAFELRDGAFDGGSVVVDMGAIVGT